MPRRTIAIGDIHGCSLALASLIEMIDPGPEDTLILLGDYIDRGPDTRGVIDQLLSLETLCRLVPILGNHDQTLLYVLDGRCDLESWLSMGGDTVLESYGAGEDPLLIPEDHVAFLGRCLDYHETDSHLFLHAQYVPDMPHGRPAGLCLALGIPPHDHPWPS